MDVNDRAPIEGEEQQAEQSAPDPHVAKATASGWRPLEEYEGDPEAWVDAKEFIKRAPLYEKNHKLKRELAEIKATLHEVKGHIGKVSEAAYSRAVADLEARRDQAIDDGDRDQVKAIDKEIKAAEAMKTPVNNGVHPAIIEWEKNNGEWFYKDTEISDFGTAHAQTYLQRNPNDVEGAMESMEKAVKRAFPEKFDKSNPKRKDPPAVETGGSQGATRTPGKADLNDEQRNVMRRFVRMGVMTEDDYIKDLAESGQLGGKK